MRKLLALIILLFSTMPFWGQGLSYTPEPRAAYINNGSGWNAWTAFAAFGALSYSPQAIGLYCQASSGAAWTPCQPGSGGGGVTSINTVTGAFTFTGAGVSCTSTTCTFSGTGSGVSSLTGDSVIFNNSASTGAVTLSLTTPAAHSVLGNFTAGAAAPTYSASPVFSAASLTNFPTFNQNTTGSAGSVLFSGVGAATNTNALVVGTGGTLGVSGTGTITATNSAVGTQNLVAVYGASSVFGNPPTATSNVDTLAGFTQISNVGIDGGFNIYQSAGHSIGSALFYDGTTYRTIDYSGNGINRYYGCFYPAATPLTAFSAITQCAMEAFANGNPTSFTQGITTPTLVSTVATGTAPFTVTSTTTVANLSVGGSAGSVANALTLNNGGSGATSGSTYNGSGAVTLSYNTLGAPGLAATTNTFTGTLNDFSGTSQIKLPVGAGYTSAANGEQGYDSTNLNWHIWNNAADNFVAVFPVASPPTSGDCVQFTKTSNSWKLADAGAACGSGGGTPAYPLTITGGVSGGVVYGSTATQLTVSPAGTVNVLMKWGGAATAPQNSLATDNGTTLTYTGTGGLAAPQFAGTGTTPSALELPAGTGSAPALPANSAGWIAPATGGTAWVGKLPATITAGILHFAAPATGDGVNESAVTSSAVSLSADVTGQLPIGSVGSSGLSGTSPVAISAAGAISITGAAGQVLAGSTPAFTATPTLGASGTLGSLTFGNATSGLLTLQTATGAITSYTIDLPVAQPSGSNNFLSCTSANPAVCTWAAASGGGLPTGTTGQMIYYASGGTTGTATSALTITSASAGSAVGVNNSTPGATLDLGSGSTLSLQATGPATPTTLNGSCTAAATSCTITSSTGYPAHGLLFLGKNNGTNEIVSCTSISGTTISGCTRGIGNGGTGTAQASGADVTLIQDLDMEPGSTYQLSYMKLFNGPLYLTGAISAVGSSNTSNETFGGTFSAGEYFVGSYPGGVDPGTPSGSTRLSQALTVDSSAFQGAATSTIAASAGTTTFAPTTPVFIVTGTAPTALATITAPSGECTATGGNCELKIVGVGFTTVTTGNIANVVAVTASKLEICEYITANTKWYCQ